MRICFDLSTFSNTHCGGKDQVAYNLLRGFSELGYTEDIICLAKNELVDVIHAIDSNYKVIPIKRYHGSGKIKMTISFLLDYIYGIKIRRIINDYKCDAIVFTNKFSPCIKMNVETVLLPHDIKAFSSSVKKISYFNGLSKFIIRKNFKLCDHIVSISDYDKTQMIHYLPEYKNKYYRLYDPICFSEIGKVDEKKYITALNIQWEHKNTITLIKAFSLIYKQIDYDLVLIGREHFTPDTKAQIDSIISNKDLNDRILFTGFIDDNALKKIISHTRIYVNPSLFEGFGMTAVEMMGARIPTIVADNTAQPEATLGLCRYYKPGTDEKALANQIIDELNNPLAESYLDEVSNKIRDEYNYIHIAEQYWEFLHSCLRRELE